MLMWVGAGSEGELGGNAGRESDSALRSGHSRCAMQTGRCGDGGDTDSDGESRAGAWGEWQPDRRSAILQKKRRNPADADPGFAILPKMAPYGRIQRK